MKRSRFSLCILAVAGALTWLASMPAAGADVQSSADITAILVQNYWVETPGKPNRAYIFNADGSCTYGNLFSPSPFPGTWQISNGKVVITFPDGALSRTLIPPINANGTRDLDAHGQAFTLTRSTVPVPPHKKRPKPSPAAVEAPAAETSVVTPALVVTADLQASASQAVQSYHDSLVFVTGADAAGSGFIANIAGANYLVTNAHVAAGIRDAQFKSLDGTAVLGGIPSIAVGEDIFCMSMPAGGKPFQVMDKVDQNAAIGDAVVVLGNAEGGGVVNTIIGRIVGIGPNLVEIDAPFVPGNSGSPIIHLKTGKVIGVATYLITQQYDLTTDKKLPHPVVRRFGYRIDSVKGWQAVNWPAFNAQAVRMESIETLTNDLSDFFRDLAENNGVVTMGRHTNPVIATRIDDWIAARSHNPSPEDIAQADADFLSYLKIACQSDINAAQSQITYDYFRRELADQKQARGEMSKGFDQIIQAVRQ